MSRAVALAGYAVLVAAAVALEVAARRARPRAATLGDAVGALLRRPPARLLLLAAWLWWGWHTFARAHWS